MAILSSVQIKTSDTEFSEEIPFGAKSEYVSHQGYNLASIIGDISDSDNIIKTQGSILKALESLNAATGNVADAITEEDLNDCYTVQTFS